MAVKSIAGSVVAETVDPRAKWPWWKVRGGTKAPIADVRRGVALGSDLFAAAYPSAVVASCRSVRVPPSLAHMGDVPTDHCVAMTTPLGGRSVQ
jgi:hypothetical protein